MGFSMALATCTQLDLEAVVPAAVTITHHTFIDHQVAIGAHQIVVIVAGISKVEDKVFVAGFAK